MTTPPITIAAMLTRVTDQLAAGGIDDAAREARYVVQAGGIDAATVLAHPDRIVDGDVASRIAAMATRRATHEPLSRILGTREFYGLEFRISPATLDPRPDTEILVQGAIEWAQMQPQPVTRMLDLGTGTGCIPISILKHLLGMTGVAVDVADDAVTTARANAQTHGVADRLDVVQSDWDARVDGTFGLITSNPPYIPSRDISNLDPEVQNHDPILALDGGDDGFEAHRKILIAIKNHLDVAGIALIEIGAGQLAEMREIIAEYGLDVDRIYMDYAGIPRVVGVCHPA